ncbi:MAG: alanine racemase [Burkholderiales bacterium]|nr:alanine racemase [Burkholderiales bacterium]
MPRPIEALIHVDALAHNLARARRAAPDARVWAVVKARAYGHGLERAYAGLRGADGFALLDLAEAEQLRRLGWRGPILLLEGCFEPRDLEVCSRLDLWHVVHCDAQIDWLAAHKTERAQRVFLKMNSGMNRLGFAPAAFRSAWARLSALPQVEEVALMTHFSDADGGRGIAHQVAVFEAATRDLPGERSLANSAATLRHAADAGVAADWVRAGIMVYGSAPDFPAHDIAHWGLRPTMTLRTRLIATQQLEAGDSVGYGSSFVAGAPMRIGIAAAGYADGYPRHAGSGTPVLVDGGRSVTVGRVSMDMIAVDLSALPGSGLGSEVTLWGEGPQGGRLPIDEVAHAAGTIGYELMCALAPRVPVRAVGGDGDADG